MELVLLLFSICFGSRCVANASEDSSDKTQGIDSCRGAATTDKLLVHMAMITAAP